MNFDYSEEQQLLADSLRRYLAAQHSFEQRKKVLDGSAEVWAKFAEMGLLALPISPDYGGFGGGAVDLMGIMEAFGEALVVEPYLATVVASRIVARAGIGAQKKALLPAVAEGRMKLAFAHTGEQSGTLPEMLTRHAAIETEAIASFHEQLAAWLPRIVYALVAIKVAAGIVSSGVAPRVPADLFIDRRASVGRFLLRRLANYLVLIQSIEAGLA